MNRAAKKQLHDAWQKFIDAAIKELEQAEGYVQTEAAKDKLRSAYTARKAKTDPLIWKLSYVAPVIEEPASITSWTATKLALNAGFGLAHSLGGAARAQSPSKKKPDGYVNERRLGEAWMAQHKTKRL